MSLPNEIIIRILEYVVWSSIRVEKEPLLEDERWEDGQDGPKLLPSYHPLYTIATRTNGVPSELENTLAALKCSSKRMQQLVVAQFRAYFKLIHNFAITPAFGCLCVNQAEAAARWDEENEGHCESCESRAAWLWTLSKPVGSLDRQPKLGIERRCQCSHPGLAKFGERGAACEACGSAPTLEWTLSKPEKWDEKDVQALCLTEKELEGAELDDDDVQGGPSFHMNSPLSRYTSLSALEITASNPTWVYRAVTEVVRSGAALRQVRVNSNQTHIADDLPTRSVCDGVLDALLQYKCDRLEILDVDGAAGDDNCTGAHAAQIFDLLVQCHSTIRHARLQHVTFDDPSSRCHRRLDDLSFSMHLTRLSLECVQGEPRNTRKLIERSASSLKFLELWDMEIYWDIYPLRRVLFPALEHFATGSTGHWWSDIPAGPYVLPWQWDCPALLYLKLQGVDLYGEHFEEEEDLELSIRRVATTLRHLRIDGTIRVHELEESDEGRDPQVKKWAELLKEELEDRDCDVEIDLSFYFIEPPQY